MALDRTYRPLCQCVRSTRQKSIRALSTTRHVYAEPTAEPPSNAAESPPPPAAGRRAEPLSPYLVHTPRSERKLIATKGIYPIGSRRRRAAIQSSTNIPFHQLPYQCFQEARKVLLEDRQEKVQEIQKVRERIGRLGATTVPAEDEAKKQLRLRSMRKYLEELKIFADVNDPLVKKAFEDGQGDMNKPIYRHLARKKWESYERKILMQRITQMDVTPDVLPTIDPSVNTTLYFNRKKTPHGDMVPSALSERPPLLNIQPYDKGERLVTIAVVNPDVPDVGKDGFEYRCHFLAANVAISPTQTSVALEQLDRDSQIIIPWLPAYAQKGLPYQRMSVWILEQPRSAPTGASKEPEQVSAEEAQEARVGNAASTATQTESVASAALSASAIDSAPLDTSQIRAHSRFSRREGFNLRGFVQKYSLKPVGVDLFRTIWDESTAGVMRRAGIVGADVEFKRKRIDPLPYKRLKGERFR